MNKNRESSLLPILILPNKLETSLHERHFMKMFRTVTEEAQIILNKIHPEVCYSQILRNCTLLIFVILCLSPCRDMSVDFVETMMAMETMTSLLAVSLW